MRFVAGLVIAILFTALFRAPLRKVPAVFYVLALALNVLLIASDYLVLLPWFREYFLFLFQSNTLAMGLFTVVMFIGVFDKGSNVRKALSPIRAELSILASLFCIGHIVKYGQAYLVQLLSGSVHVPVVRYWSLGIATLLVLLLIPLAITSIKRIHVHMTQSSWQRLQRFAYLFFGLVFVHIVLSLLPPALGGSLAATISVFVYLVLGILYAVLRIRLYLLSRLQIDPSVTPLPD